jgi:hypothetical protein
VFIAAFREPSQRDRRLSPQSKSPPPGDTVGGARAWALAACASSSHGFSCWSRTARTPSCSLYCSWARFSGCSFSSEVRSSSPLELLARREEPHRGEEIAGARRARSLPREPLAHAARHSRIVSAEAWRPVLALPRACPHRSRTTAFDRSRRAARGSLREAGRGDRARPRLDRHPVEGVLGLGAAGGPDRCDPSFQRLDGVGEPPARRRFRRDSGTPSTSWKWGSWWRCRHSREALAWRVAPRTSKRRSASFRCAFGPRGPRFPTVLPDSAEVFA